MEKIGPSSARLAALDIVHVRPPAPGSATAILSADAADTSGSRNSHSIISSDVPIPFGPEGFSFPRS
jgi:hypothetical protein